VALATALAPTTRPRTLEQQTAALVALMADRQVAKARGGAAIDLLPTPLLLQINAPPTVRMLGGSSHGLASTPNSSIIGAVPASSDFTFTTTGATAATVPKHGFATHGALSPRHHANAAFAPTAADDDGHSRVLFFVMTSALISRKRYTNKNLFEERAVPAMRTWAAAFPRTWFVMDAGPAASAALEGCHFAAVAEADASELLGDGDTAATGANGASGHGALHRSKQLKAANWTVADCSGAVSAVTSAFHLGSGVSSPFDVSRPVLLADCDNGYWGVGGPCCKCETALRFAAGLLGHVEVRNNASHALGAQSNRATFGERSRDGERIRSRSAHGLRAAGLGLVGAGAPRLGASVAPFDWVVFSDDDMYYAPKPFAAFLRRHDSRVAQVLGQRPRKAHGTRCKC
jgi:hypothetical protein